MFYPREILIILALQVNDTRYEDRVTYIYVKRSLYTNIT